MVDPPMRAVRWSRCRREKAGLMVDGLYAAVAMGDASSDTDIRAAERIAMYFIMVELMFTMCFVVVGW